MSPWSCVSPTAAWGPVLQPAGPSCGYRGSPARLRRGGRESDARLFSVVPSDRTGSSGHKLKHKEFHLNVGKNFALRVAEHRNRLPREFLESASLETFKTHLDAFLCHLLEMTLPWQGGWTG